jgi:hypothetical protein
VYLAEEMTAIPVQNQVSQGQEGIQIVSTTTLVIISIDFLQILGQIMTGTEIITSVVVDTICIPSCPCDTWAC